MLAAYAHLITPEPTDTALAPSAASIDDEVKALVADGGTQVLLIGSSHLGRGIETNALARALNLAPKDVHALWRSNMQPPHWFAILKNRVYENQLNPPVVLVVSTLRRTMQVNVEGGRRMASLVEQLSEFEPAIDQKVFRKQSEGGGAWGLAKARRTRFRESLTDGIKGRVTGWGFVDPTTLAPGQSRSEAGEALADDAMERLLGSEGAKDLTLQSRVIPIVEDAREVHEDDKDLIDPIDTLVPDFIDLIQSHGGKVVFVDLPVSPKVAADHEVDPDLARAFVELLNKAGAGFIDLHDMPVENLHFRDTTHLNKKGAALVTAALAEALRPLNLLDGGAEVPEATLSLERLLRPKIERTGDVPVLAHGDAIPGKGKCAWEITLPTLPHLQERELKSFGLGAISPVIVLQDGEPLKPFGVKGSFRGDTCKGRSWNSGKSVRFTALPGTTPTAADFQAVLTPDVPFQGARDEVHWVFPSTTLAITMPGAETMADADAVVKLTLRQAGDGALPTLIGPDGAEHPFEQTGSLVHATQTVRPGTGNWQVQVKVPEDGASFVVAQVEVTALDTTSAIVGVQAAGTETATAFAKSGPYALSFKTPAPDLGPIAGPFRKVTEHAARVQLPELQMLSMTNLRERLLVDRSPLRVSEDGKVLDGANTTCLKVRNTGGGTYCHHDERLFLSSAIGGRPGDNGHKYSLSLTEDRGIGGGWILYPGDVMSAPVPPPRLDELPGRIHAVRFSGAMLEDTSPDTEALRLRIFDRNVLVLDERITAGQLNGKDIVVKMPQSPSVQSGSKPVFRIQTAAGGPYVWVKSPLLEHQRQHTGRALPGAPEGLTTPSDEQ